MSSRTPLRYQLENFFYKVPARSCGPLGINDQADPNVSSLLGDTPGPLGINDHAAPFFTDNKIFLVGSTYHTLDGIAMSRGVTPEVSFARDEPNIITAAMLKAVEPSNSQQYYNSIVTVMNELARAYGVTTPLRIAHFLAQISTESKFKAVAENGNYDPKRMRQVFGCKGGARNYDATHDDAKKGRLREKLWTDEGKYAHNAKNLLSYVYASRLGNGDEASGDGFKYRGRGMMQLTGKCNYEEFTKTHNKKNPDDPQDFVATPDLVASEIEYAVESAFFFWDSRELNKIADTDNVDTMTLRINGGYNGHSERKARLATLKQYFRIST